MENKINDEDEFLSEKLNDSTNIDQSFKIMKIKNIRNCLQNNDKLALKTYAITANGFIDNDLRVQVWSKLLDTESMFCDKEAPTVISNEFVRQVVLDVDRSLKRFPPSVKENERIKYQDSLTKLIIKILNTNPSLHYYQGYHDICLTLLLIMNEEKAFQITNQISNLHLKFFMEKTMNTTSNLLEIIYLILKEEHRVLYDFLIKSEVGTIFSLSWVITWFSHVLNDLNDIIRLFDFFISNHFLAPIYLTITILLHKEAEIFLVDCDMASVHKYLTSIPENEHLPFDDLIHQALKLLVKYPPEDTLEKQKEMQTNALNGDSPKLIDKSYQFLRQNIFSLTFFGLFSAIVYQVYNDYVVT